MQSDRAQHNVFLYQESLNQCQAQKLLSTEGFSRHQSKAVGTFHNGNRTIDPFPLGNARMAKPHDHNFNLIAYDSVANLVLQFAESRCSCLKL